MDLHSAARAGDLEEVSRLLAESSARVDAKDEMGWTALMLVAALGHDCRPHHGPIARLLLDNGADPNARSPLGWTPIHMIAINGSAASLPVARVLLDGGAELAAVTNDGVTDWSMLWQHGSEVWNLLSSASKRGGA